MRRLLPSFCLLLMLIVASRSEARAQGGTGTAAVQGTVTVPDADLLPTVMISAMSVDSSASGNPPGFGFAIPDADGNFRIDGLGAGRYVVVARSPEYALQFYDGAESASDATVLELADGDMVDGIDFVLTRPGVGSGAMEGTVRAAADGAPLAGARVLATGVRDARVRFETRTETDGRYRIDGMGSGQYRVEAGAAGFVPQFFDEARAPALATPVTVTDAGIVTDINFRLSVSGAVSGTVRDRDGSPLEGVLVEAVAPHADSSGTVIGPDGQMTGGAGGGFSVTGPDGTYRIDGLASGEYLVLAVGHSAWRRILQWYDGAETMHDATPITILAGVETSGIDFDLPFAGGHGDLAGTVLDENGAPLERVFVQAFEAGSDSGSAGGPACCPPIGFAETHPDGRYEFLQLPVGDYVILASARGQWSLVERWYPDAVNIADAVVVGVLRGQRTGGIDIALPSGAGGSSIAGRVTDTAGQGLAGARVLLESVDDPTRPTDDVPVQAFAGTDSSGAYAIRGLPAGSYTVMASWWDGDRFGQIWYNGASSRQDATAVDLAESEARTGIDLAIDPAFFYGSLGGLVTDASSGAPVDRAFVQVHPASAAAGGAPIRWPDAFALTGPDGRFVIENLPVGDYRVSAHADGAFGFHQDGLVAEQARLVAVVGGDVADASVRLHFRNDGAGSIEGNVRVDHWMMPPDSASGAVPRVAVVEARPMFTILSWPESELFYTAVTRPDGSYALRGLPDGEFIVTAFAPAFVPEFWDDAYDPARATPVVVAAGGPTPAINFDLVPSMFMDASGQSRDGDSIIRGRVTDDSGNGVAGATVILMDPAGTPVASTTTAQDGTYVFPGVALGLYRIMVSKQGHETAFNGDAPSLDESAAVAVETGETVVDLTMSQGTSTHTEGDGQDLPESFELLGNYPNPFNPATTILLDLPARADVSLTVFDLLGRRVFRATPANHGAGRVALTVDASSWPSGLYVYRVEAAGSSGMQVAVGRMMLIR